MGIRDFLEAFRRGCRPIVRANEHDILILLGLVRSQWSPCQAPKISIRIFSKVGNLGRGYTLNLVRRGWGQVQGKIKDDTI